ncbi:DUF2231 domain-containing protein [Aegicerativicinus sediminis]
MDIETFVGRFHPIFVHLPIGIFIIGFLIDVLIRFKPQFFPNSLKVLKFIYATAFISAIIAVITGLLLSWSNNYEVDRLNLHRNLGLFSLAGLAVLLFFTLSKSFKKEKARFVFSIICVLLIALTGHFGGNLTHGPDYLLEKGPKFLQGYTQRPLYENEQFKTANPDSLNIYLSIVKPLIDRKCLGCHDSENALGNLSLVNLSDFKNNLKHENLIVSGNAHESEFFKRISLPIDDQYAMPPNNNKLNYTDIQVIKYWIDNGADSLSYFSSDLMNSDLIALVKRDYGLDYTPKPFYEKIAVEKVGDSMIKTLKSNKIVANYLSESNNLLDVKINIDSISEVQIEGLNKIADKVTFLNIEGCKLNNILLQKLSTFPNLTKLNVSNNQILNEDASWLLKQDKLEVLNLNGTLISTDVLNSILSMPKLRRIYVWNTNVPTEELDNLRNKNSGIEIISEFTFEEFEQPKPVFSAEER